MNDSGLTEEEYRQLWCQCGGDPNAVPLGVLIIQEIEKQHETAWITGVVYVSVVVVIYCTVLSHLIYKFDQTCSCCSLLFCVCLDQSKRGSRRKRRQPSSQVLQKGGKLTQTHVPEDTRKTETSKLRVPEFTPETRTHQVIEASVKVTVEWPSQEEMEESLGSLHSDCELAEEASAPVL